MRRTLGGMLAAAVLMMRLMMEADQVRVRMRMRVRMLGMNRRVVGPRRGSRASGRSAAPRRRRRRCRGRGRGRRRRRRRGRRRRLVPEHVDLVVVLVVGIRGRVAARARLAPAAQGEIYGTFSGRRNGYRLLSRIGIAPAAYVLFPQLLLMFHPSILEPRFHLSFRQM